MTAEDDARKRQRIADGIWPPDDDPLPDWDSLVTAARDRRYSDEFVGAAFRSRLHRRDSALADRGSRTVSDGHNGGSDA